MRTSNKKIPTAVWLLPFLAAAFLVGSGIYFYLIVHQAFPDQGPVPPPAAPINKNVRGNDTASLTSQPLTVYYDLLTSWDHVDKVELPQLDSGYETVVKKYGHILSLPSVSDLSDPLRKLAVAVPLGVKPASDEEVDHELRHALYLPTPGRIVWRVRLPPAARLKFALAVLPVSAVPDKITMTVRVCLPGKSQPVLVAPFALMTAEVSPDTGLQLPPWWSEAEMDLSSLAGQEVALEFITESTPPDDAVATPHPAHVLVAGPKVLGGSGTEQKRAPNLLWINIDTVQAGVTGIGGDTHHTTPELDRIAAQGVMFRRSFAASNWTRPSNMSFLTGLHPSESGMKVDMIPTLFEERRSYYLSDRVALPLYLSRHGYRTRGIAQNNMLEDVWGTGVDVGFQEYHYVQDTLDHSNKITRDAIRFMEHHQAEPWFLYLSYNAPHWPYRPSGQHIAKVGMAGDDPADWLKSLYRAEVSLSDAHLAPLMETLHNLQIDQDTLVIINSDHGEQLDAEQEQEIIRANLWHEGLTTHERTRPGHETLLAETIHVPLVMRWSGHLPAATEIDVPVSTVDIPPTIVDLLGLPPMQGIRGRSVVPSIYGRSQASLPLLIEGKSIRGVIDWPLKYIRRDGDKGKDWVRWIAREERLHRVPEELYNLEQDPHERINLIDDQPEELHRMRRLLVSLTPADRYLYFIEARGPDQEEDPAMHLHIRLSPAQNIANLHLLAGEPDDRIIDQQGTREVFLSLGHNDIDRLVVRTKAATDTVDITFSQMHSDQAAMALPVELPVPLWLGQAQLLTTRANFVISDSDTSVHLDSTRDPVLSGAGVAFWRIPVTGGIPGRSGKLAETMQETFRSWGYAR